MIELLPKPPNNALEPTPMSADGRLIRFSTSWAALMRLAQLNR